MNNESNPLLGYDDSIVTNNTEHVSDKRLGSEAEVGLRKITLKAIRQIAYNIGYAETANPTYLIEGDTSSDIHLGLNTFDNGLIDIFITGQGDVRITVNRTLVEDGLWQPKDNQEIRLLEEMKVFDEQIHTRFPNASISFADADDQHFSLPEMISKTNRQEDEADHPPRIPLEQQRLIYDAHSGRWFGSPKN